MNDQQDVVDQEEKKEQEIQEEIDAVDAEVKKAEDTAVK